MTNDYSDLADRAEAGQLMPKPGTARRGPAAAQEAARQLLEASGADTIDQISTLALGRPKLGAARSKAGPSPIWKVRADAALFKSTAAAADQRGVTVSELVREAVAEYLQIHDIPANAQQKGDSGPSGSLLEGTKRRIAMAAKKNIHTVPTADGWANRREGGKQASSTHATKAEAQAAGREAAKGDKVEHLIHKKDGTIGERNSYGNDPHPPKG